MGPWLSLWLVTVSQSLPVTNDNITSSVTTTTTTTTEHSDTNLSGNNNDKGEGRTGLPLAYILFKKYSYLQTASFGKENAFWNAENEILHFVSNRESYQSGINDNDYLDDSDNNNHVSNYQSFEECLSDPINNFGSVQMVSTCPRDYGHRGIRDTCESNSIKSLDQPYGGSFTMSLLPVADVNGNVFANRFCALCHNISQFASWKFSFECDTIEIDGNINNTDQILESCVIMGLSPYNASRHLDSTCRNPSLPTTTTPKRVKRSEAQTEESQFPVSFSILMNFGFDGKSHILLSEAHHTFKIPEDVDCPEGKIYDPDNNVCRPVVCDKGYILRNQHCIEIPAPDPTPTQTIDENTIPDDVAQVSLEVNVSYSDYFLLFSKDFQTGMITKLSLLFNISESRIMNLTIQPMEGPGSGNILEIHHFKTRHARLRRKGFKLPHVRQRAEKKLSESHGNSSVHQHIPLEEFVRNKFFFEAVLAFLGPIVGNKAGNATRNQGGDGINETNGIQSSTQPPGPQTSVGVNFTSTQSMNAGVNLTNKYESTTIDQTNSDATKRTTKKPDDTEIVVVKISFLLLPPLTESVQESSVEKTVEKMSNMVDSKRFKIEVRNTRISVISVVNEGEPLSVSSWCKGGIINAYGDEQVSVFLHDNKTLLYVNETKDIYWPGQYDLMVYLEGSLVNNVKSLDTLSGYAFVCTMPRIKDSSCSTILLQDHEYSINNHDKTLMDVYTKTNRSIYQYRLIGNDSVEICMFDLADKSCARIELSSDEYEMLSNKSIIYSGEMYNILQYETSGNGSVEICIPRNYFSEKGDNLTDQVTGCDLAEYTIWLKAEGYLTAILSIISICSMTIVLVTYCLFQRLRNLPGTNTMNLTIALCVAETVFEFGSSSPNHHVCIAVGVVLHYFFLASFFWMNIMAYDVFQTFANSCILTRVRSKSKYLKKYALYAWGCPAVIVTLCSVIDFSGIFKKIHIGYGPNLEENFSNLTPGVVNTSSTSYHSSRQRLGCWIQEPMAALAAFGGPILIILLVNAVFYVKAIICIRSTSRSSVKISNRSYNRRLTGQNDVIIYVRMSTVMGFTWIIGFTSSFISSVASNGGSVICLVLRILTILFTLFNCSQGFLIFFVFVFNRRVGRLYKQFIEHKWIACKKYLHRPASFSLNKQNLAISKIS